MIDFVMKFVPTHQLDTLVELGLDSSVDALLGIVENIHSLPNIYAQDGMKGEAKAYLHYFGGCVDIYVTEFDGDETLYTFGSCFPDGEFEGGYQILGSESELTNTPGLELDLHFDPKPLKWIEDDRNPYYSK